MQTARNALTDEFNQMVGELELSRSNVAELEAELREEEEKREKELDKCTVIIRDLQKQLTIAEEHRKKSKTEVS